MKNKLKLKELKINSFVTEVDKTNKETLGGGNITPSAIVIPATEVLLSAVESALVLLSLASAAASAAEVYRKSWSGCLSCTNTICVDTCIVGNPNCPQNIEEKRIVIPEIRGTYH